MPFAVHSKFNCCCTPCALYCHSQLPQWSTATVLVWYSTSVTWC